MHKKAAGAASRSKSTKSKTKSTGNPKIGAIAKRASKIYAKSGRKGCKAWASAMKQAAK